MPVITRVIALDGPSGAGKSTVARAVASALGWAYLDTGATYRAATLAVLRAGLRPSTGVAPQDGSPQNGSAGPDELTAAVTAVVLQAEIGLRTDPTAPGVLLDGEDVSAEIRGAAVTGAVSAVSAVPDVRQHLVALQQRLIGAGGAVVEGRDICTVVAPEAAVKVYLFADPEVRAARRAAETGPPAPEARTPDATAPHGDAGSTPDVRAIALDLARRDALDAGRTTSPAVRPDGAHPIDASLLTADEVSAVVLGLARDAGLTDSI